MAADDPGYARDETSGQRLDRNYAELLQELRVAQAGVQIMFAFLLTVPFQPKFDALTSVQKGTYLTVLMAAGASVIAFVAPAAAHRVMFRKGLKYELVAFTARAAVAGLGLLALTMLGAVGLVVDLVAGRIAAGVAIGAGAVLLGVVWWLLPIGMTARTHIRSPAEPAAPIPDSPPSPPIG